MLCGGAARADVVDPTPYDDRPECGEGGGYLRLQQHRLGAKAEDVTGHESLERHVPENGKNVPLHVAAVVALGRRQGAAGGAAGAGE